MAQLGKYQLVAEIARGGMGIVYLAVARGPARFSKLLVVKQLKPELAEDPQFLEMFLEEARLAARLNHPNIVQTYEVGNDENRHYMVMDYLDGVTLARALRRKNPSFVLGMHLRVIAEALSGLHYAHTLTDFDGSALGIVHRDATPQNVFITYDGQVKLVDFGIAKALDSTVETTTGVLKGKPSYMAPEQIAGDVDPRADVFTAGVMIWEAVAGRRMWHKKGDVEILTNIIKGQVPSISEAAPDAPAQIIRIIEKAVAKTKDERYASAADLLADLEGFLKMSGQDHSMKSVAKVVQEMFAAERVAVKATIDTHLAGLKQTTTSGASLESVKLPSIHPGAPTSDPDAASNTTPVSNPNQPSSLVAGAHSTSSAHSLTPGMGRTPPGTEIPTPLTTMGAEETGFLAKKNRALIGGIAVIGMIVLVGAVAIAVKKKDGNGSGNGTTASSEQNVSPDRSSVPGLGGGGTPPPVAMTLASHDVTLRAYPKTAVLTIDGAEVSNPVKRKCEHGRSFSVHASATGHVSVDRTIPCDTDGSIEIALTSQPAAAYTPPPWSPPRPNPATTTAAAKNTAPPSETTPPKAPANNGEVNPNGGTKPNRPIDTSSPYNNK